MSLSRIIMRLARNPGTEFAEGDDHRGYTLTAPLTPERGLDVEAWRKVKETGSPRSLASTRAPPSSRLKPVSCAAQEGSEPKARMSAPCAFATPAR